MQNPADKSGGERIGKAMNFYRRQSNLSQQAVAGLLSVPYQTYRKYENGIDPIPRNRLSAFLQHLKIPPAEFEATLADINCAPPVDVTEGVSEDTLLLVDSFITLDRNGRRNVLDMVKTMLQKKMNSPACKTDRKKI